METGKHYDKEQLLLKVDLVALLEAHGVSLKQNGRSLKGLCPFHADTNPSLSVDREKKIWKCFGCGEGGDSISFVRKLKGLEFQAALEYLDSFAGIGGVSKQPVRVAKKRSERMTEAPVRATVSPNRTTEQKAPNLTTEQKASDRTTEQKAPNRTTEQKAPNRTTEMQPAAIGLDAVVEYYHKQLYGSREAVAYLEGRGITDHTLYARFKLGYADGSLLEKISSKQLEALKVLGLVRESGKEHFADCVIFPLFDEHERAVSLYGRSVHKESTMPHLYSPGPHKSVFNRKASKVYDEIILTECIIDALSLVQLGFQNVQAIYGTNGFTEEHLALLKADRVKTVVLALDNDAAGKKASGELADKLTANGLDVKAIFPDAKDWNEQLCASGSETAATIKARLEDAALKPGAHLLPAIEVHKSGGKYLFTASGISYRVLGVKKAFVSSLRINMRAEQNEKKYLDNVDLYSARSRTLLSENLSRLFETPESRIEGDLFALVDWLEAERDRELLEGEAAPRELSAEEEQLGRELLESPKLFYRIVEDLSVLGYVGEELNKQLIYIAAASRKLDDPISVLILSQSASGKSLLVETVRRLLPPEDVVAVSSLSDQALNYVSEGGLVHKFLLLGEAVHSEVVEHQIREMLSNHELSRMVTTKNEKTGQMETGIVKSTVIVSAMLSSTRYDVNPENASRCFVINTDESREQTRNIHQAQRRKYSMERICEKHNDVPAIIRQHHAAQRMLKKRIIINPLAEHLAFPDSLMRTRRDHERFIDLIVSVCFLRQYQKSAEEQADTVTGETIRYITCDIEDYRIAYEIIRGILPATINNFPVGALQLYDALRELARKLAAVQKVKPEEVLLSQRAIREATSLNQMAIKRHMRLLADYEYIRSFGAGKRGSRSNYSLLADEPIRLLDLSMIPTPEEMAGKLKKES